MKSRKILFGPEMSFYFYHRKKTVLFSYGETRISQQQWGNKPLAHFVQQKGPDPVWLKVEGKIFAGRRAYVLQIFWFSWKIFLDMR